MNVLFLTPRLPYPLDCGASIRIFNLIKRISKKHNITLVSLIQNEKEDLSFLLSYCQTVEVVLKKESKSKLNLIIGLMLNLFSMKPYTITKYYSLKMKRKIKEMIHKNDFDLIHCEHLHMAQYIQDVKSIPKILDEINTESIIAKRYVSLTENYFKKIVVFLFQYMKILKYEARICEQFSLCLAVSATDKKSLLKMNSKINVEVIPNGVDLNYFKPVHDNIEPNSLVFIGAMSWLPNEDAMLYFYYKILPLLKNKVSSIKLFVVGKQPSYRVLKLKDEDSSIIVTGYVEDVRSYIAKSEVYIVPLRIGGGSRLKILEALAMGKAVVSTSVGAEGLELTAGRDILIADSPEEFARKTMILLKDDELRKKLGREGRKTVEDNYSWEGICEKLDNIYGGITK